MHATSRTGRLLLTLLVLSAGQGAEGQELSRREAPAGGAGGSRLEVTFHLDDGLERPVVELPRGQRVRLVLVGATGHEMHLHGYDVVVEGRAGEPAVFDFDAAHAGRFPITVHGTEDLLGSGERALLYVEVRDP